MFTSILLGRNVHIIYKQSVYYKRILSKGLYNNSTVFREISCSNRCMVANVEQQRTKTELRSFRRQPLNVDNALQKLDLAVRRAGRVTKQDVKEVYNELKNTGKASSIQSLLVLRCCGSLLAEELPETRTEFVTDVWGTFVNLGIQLDVSHYNALLKVYLENEHEFNPAEFLSEMVKKGIDPNRVTFQRLIEHYCQSGDIEGAGKILEHMKQQELPVSEKVFNALITGHARANDMESAKGVIELMKNAKLEPSADSYTTLINAFAERGDIKTIREIMQEVQKSQISLTNENYLEIVYSLAKNGHAEHVDEILTKLQRNVMGFITDNIITIYKLINCKQDEVAFKLLKLLPVSRKPNQEMIPVGNFFIRQMVRMERPPENIVKICNELKSLNLNNEALQKAAESALFCGKEAHAIYFMKLLKEENFPIRPHYFWPLFCICKKKNDLAKVYDILTLMTDMGVDANYVTFVDYVYPSLNIQSSALVIDKLKSIGYTAGKIVSPLVDHFIQEKNMTEANKLIETYEIRFNPSSLVDSLITSCREPEDIGPTLKILKKVKESASKELTRVAKIDWTGEFLMGFIRHKSRSAEKIEPLLQGLSDENLHISQVTQDIIRNKIWSSMPENIATKLDKLATSSADDLPEESDQIRLTHTREMELDELESQLIELKNKNMNTRAVLRLLLLRHAQKKNIQRVEELISELDAENFVYSPGVMAQLLELYVYHDNLEKANKYFNAIKQAQPDFSLDHYKILKYAALLVKEDQVDDAYKILSENVVNTEEKDPKFLERSVWHFLNVASEKDPETCEKLFELLKKKSYCKPTNNVLGPLIKAYLLKDDLPGAVAKFEECSKLYSCTPWRNDLFVRLINLEDTDRLQKLVDINNSIHGEENTLHDLAFAFLLCQRYKEARKVLETPGLRAKDRRLEKMCEHLLEENKIAELEQLAIITEDLFDVNRDRIYFHIIRAHCKNKDPKKALSVWTTMQEENVHPSDETLIYLAKCLQDHNELVPFAIPEGQKEFIKHSFKDSIPKRTTDITQGLNVSGNQSINQPSSRIERLIEEQRLNDKKIWIEVSLTSDVRNNEAWKIAVDMLEKNLHPYPRVFRRLVNEVAQNGDVDGVKSLESKLSQDQKNLLRYNDVLFRAYIHSNRHLEFIENLEKNVESTLTTCPRISFLTLLEKYPDLCDRVHKLAIEYTKYDNYDLLNTLWNHYIINENYQKADEIFKESPKLQTNLQIGTILNHYKKNGNEELCLKLLEIIKSSQVPSERKGKIYTTLIQINCEKNNFEKASEYLELAKKENVDSFLFPRTLEKLASGLEKEVTQASPQV